MRHRRVPVDDVPATTVFSLPWPFALGGTLIAFHLAMNTKQFRFGVLDRWRSAFLGGVLMLATVGCGNSDQCTNLPMTQNCVPLGVSTIDITTVCPSGSGGADDICTIVLSTSNGNLSIGTPVIRVWEDSSRTDSIQIIGSARGQVTVSGLREDGTTFDIGNLTVGC